MVSLPAHNRKYAGSNPVPATMRIEGVVWTEKINVLKVRCACGVLILHPANRWKVRCRDCKKTENLEILRKKYLEERLESP